MRLTQQATMPTWPVWVGTLLALASLTHVLVAGDEGWARLRGLARGWNCSASSCLCATQCNEAGTSAGSLSTAGNLGTNLNGDPALALAVPVFPAASRCEEMRMKPRAISVVGGAF